MHGWGSVGGKKMRKTVHASFCSGQNPKAGGKDVGMMKGHLIFFSSRAPQLTRDGGVGGEGF